MTLEKLKQLRYLRILIQRERERLEDLQDSLSLRSPNLSGMPKAPGAHDKIGDTVPVILDGEQGISDLLRQLEQQEAEIVSWIRKTPPNIQLITNLRFIDDLSWMEIADQIGGNETDCSVKNMFYRYLKRWNIEHPDDERSA